MSWRAWSVAHGSFHDPEVRKKLGMLFRRLRTERGLSQEDVAYTAEIGLRYYVDVEHGKRRLSIEVGQKIAQALGLRLQDVLDLVTRDSEADQQ